MKGWKQAYTDDFANIVIVELLIPDDAKIKHISRYGDTKDFYICNKAKVLSIESIDSVHKVDVARSMKDIYFKYKVGCEVEAKLDNWFGKRPGIYFFDSRERAVNYEY